MEAACTAYGKGIVLQPGECLVKGVDYDVFLGEADDDSGAAGVVGDLEVDVLQPRRARTPTSSQSCMPRKWI